MNAADSGGNIRCSAPQTPDTMGTKSRRLLIGRRESKSKPQGPLQPNNRQSADFRYLKARLRQGEQSGTRGASPLVQGQALLQRTCVSGPIFRRPPSSLECSGHPRPWLLPRRKSKKYLCEICRCFRYTGAADYAMARRTVGGETRERLSWVQHLPLGCLGATTAAHAPNAHHPMLPFADALACTAFSRAPRQGYPRRVTLKRA